METDFSWILNYFSSNENCIAFDQVKWILQLKPLFVWKLEFHISTTDSMAQKLNITIYLLIDSNLAVLNTIQKKSSAVHCIFLSEISTKSNFYRSFYAFWFSPSDRASHIYSKDCNQWRKDQDQASPRWHFYSNWWEIWITSLCYFRLGSRKYSNRFGFENRLLLRIFSS